jgi:hypothetical protein
LGTSRLGFVKNWARQELGSSGVDRHPKVRSKVRAVHRNGAADSAAASLWCGICVLSEQMGNIGLLKETDS